MNVFLSGLPSATGLRTNGRNCRYRGEREGRALRLRSA